MGKVRGETERVNAAEAEIEHLRRQMQEDGCDPGNEPLIANGRFHTVQTDDAGHSGGKAPKPWYIVRKDGRVYYGDWRTGSKFQTYYPGPVDVGCRTAERALDDSVRARCHEIFWSSPVASDSHPYCALKGVPAHGCHLFTGNRLVIGGVNVAGALIVPILDMQWCLQGLQFICADGTKRNLGRRSGGFFWVPEHPPSSFPGRVGVAEGFATAASAHRIMDDAVCITFGHSGFASVVRWLRWCFPHTTITIVADGDDASRRSANAAARAAKALVWSADDGLDVNDMEQRR